MIIIQQLPYERENKIGSQQLTFLHAGMEPCSCVEQAVKKFQAMKWEISGSKEIWQSPNFEKQHQPSLSPNFFGLLWILKILVKVSHMYYFPPFYSIQCHSLCFFFDWHEFVQLFCSLNLNHSFLNMTKQSQVTFPLFFFLNKGHPYL